MLCPPLASTLRVTSLPIVVPRGSWHGYPPLPPYKFPHTACRNFKVVLNWGYALIISIPAPWPMATCTVAWLHGCRGSLSALVFGPSLALAQYPSRPMGLPLAGRAPWSVHTMPVPLHCTLSVATALRFRGHLPAPHPSCLPLNYVWLAFVHLAGGAAWPPSAQTLPSHPLSLISRGLSSPRNCPHRQATGPAKVDDPRTMVTGFFSLLRSPACDK